MPPDPTLAYAPDATGNATPPVNPFLPDKWQLAGMALMGLGSGVSAAAARNQPAWMGISQGAQNFNNNYYNMLGRGMNYDLALKNYQLQAGYKQMQEQMLGLQTKQFANTLAMQKLGIDYMRSHGLLGAGPQTGPTPGFQPPQAPLMGPGAVPNDNNIGNVRPPGQTAGFQTAPDFNSGVAMTVNNARAYPAAFNGGQPMNIMQIAQRWAPRGDGNNDPNAWAFNVSRGSGLDPNQPLDLSNPQIAAQFARGVHLAEKGPNVVRPVADYLPGASVPQQGGQPQQAPQGPQSPSGLPPVPQAPPDPTSLYMMSSIPGLQWAGGIAKGQQAQFENEMARYKAMQGDPAYKAMVPQVRQSFANIPPEELSSMPAATRMALQGAITKGDAKEAGNILGKFEGGIPWEYRNVHGQAFLDKMPPAVQQLVPMLLNGNISVADLPQRAAASGVDPQKVNLMAIAHQVDPSFDASMGGSKRRFEESLASGDNAKTIQAFSVAIPHMRTWLELQQGLQNGNSPAVNNIINRLKEQYGNDKVPSAEAAGHLLATEIAKAIGGELTVSGQQSMKEFVDSDLNNPQAAKLLQTLAAMGSARFEMLQDRARYYKMSDDQIAGLKSKRVSDDLDFLMGKSKPQQAQAPISGIPAVGFVSKGYRFKGGNPADQNSWERVQ